MGDGTNKENREGEMNLVKKIEEEMPKLCSLDVPNGVALDKGQGCCGGWKFDGDTFVQEDLWKGNRTGE